MADPIVVKVSELTELTDLATGDLVTVVDVSEAVSANKTKKLQAGNLKLFTSGQLANSIVTAAQLANDAVETVAIKDLNVTTEKLADNAVTNAKLRDSAALSVMGRSANTVGDPADITAGLDGQVLRRSGTTVGFGQVVAAGIADNAVETAKIKDLNVTTTKLAAKAVTTAKIADEAVTETQLGAIKRTVAIPVFGFEDNVIVKNFTNLFSFPPMLNGHVITSVSATLLGAVSVSGALTIKLINGLNEMASVTINQNAWSGTATPNTSYDDVASFGKFSVNVTGAGSGAKGLTVYLEVTG